MGEARNGFWHDTWRELRKRPKFVVAAVLILFVLAVAAFPALFSGADPTYADPSQSLLGPSATHWFGTDLQGHDIYARTVYGARASVTVGLGAVLFVIGSYELSHITAQSGSTEIVIPLIVTGFGFACLFIPLTTAALTFVSRAQLADGAGLNSFIRQIGGSFGLTIFATLLSNYSRRATASVGWHVSGLRPEVVQRLHQIGFTNHGTARGVDDQHARLHGRNCLPADEMPGCSNKRTVERNNICRLEQRFHVNPLDAVLRKNGVIQKRIRRHDVKAESLSL